MTKTNDELDAVLESIEWLDDDGGAFVSNDGAVFRFAMLKSLAADYRRLKAEVIETCPECGFNLHFDGEMDVCYRCLSDEWRHLNEQTTQRWMVEKNENERLKAERDVAVRAVEHYADYKNWPGANPNIPGSKASKEAWQDWYQKGGYHGYDVAREALAEIAGGKDGSN